MEYRHTDQNDEGIKPKESETDSPKKDSRFILSVKPQPFHLSIFQMQIYPPADLLLLLFYERLSNCLHCKIKYSRIPPSSESNF